MPPKGASSNAESVHVCVRVRPLSEKEVKDKRKSALDVDVQRGQIQVNTPVQGNAKPLAFTFDKVYNTDSKQQDIFNGMALPIVESCMQGYNGTIFAYGQTGAGKSYTMEGKDSPADAKGIMPRTFDHIFSRIKQDSSKDYLVRASYLELYNEDILDLLSKNPNAKLDLKENPDRGVYVKDLSQVVCDSREQINGLLEAGRKNRSTGSTQMNQDSSRSHSIFTITIETAEKLETKAAAKPGKKEEESHICVGKLNLVDLAGSERQSKTGATGDRLKEGIKINLSLTSLGNVISALVDAKATHVPYRDSKLTRLLQDSLGGNTKTVMIANVGPADYNCEETVSTLRYANRAKNIQNKPRINEDPKDAMLREYQDEIKRLRALLAAKGEQPQDGEKGRQQLEAARAEGRAEAERLQQQQDTARKENDARQLEVARKEGRAEAEQLQRQQEGARKEGEAKMLEAAKREGRAEAEQVQKQQEGARRVAEAQQEKARSEREAQQLAAARKEGKEEAERVARQQEAARSEREAQQLAAARKEGKEEAERVARQQEAARSEREAQQLAAARKEGKAEAERVAKQQEAARSEREAQQLAAARKEGKEEAERVARQQDVARREREAKQLEAAKKEGKEEAERVQKQQEAAHKEREARRVEAAKEEGRAEAGRAQGQQEQGKQRPGFDLPQHQLPGEDMLAFLERKHNLLPHELQELRRLQQERERLKQEAQRMGQELQRLNVAA